MRNRSVTDAADLAFAALADPTRRQLLDLLRTGGRTPAGLLADSFAISRPAISKHLRLLRRARLVRERRQGRHRFYQIDPQPLRAVDKWLAHYRTFWEARLSNLKDYLEDEPRATGETLNRSSGTRKGRPR